MELYNIYSFLSSPFFIIILFFSFLFCIGNFIDSIVSFIKKRSPNNFTLNSFLKNYDISFKARKLIAILIQSFLIFLALFSNNNFIMMLGCEDIRVMPEGTYCYYVLATNENDKTYTLPAKIEKNYETYDLGEGDIRHSQDYYIENVYFENGGYLYFGDDCEFNENIKTEKYTARGYDQNENEWEIELTNQKTSHPKVDEVSNFSTYKLLEGFVMAFCFLIMAFLNFIQLLKGKDKDY